MSRTMFVVAMLITMAACTSQRDDSLSDIPPLDVAQIAAHTSDFQRDLLADGVITFAEYEIATLATIQCLRDAGLTVEGPHPRNQLDNRYLDFSYGVQTRPSENTADSDKRMFATGDACEASYRTDVARVWEFQLLLTPEVRNDQKVLVIECLQSAGVNLPSEASHQEVLRAAVDRNSSAVVRCRERYPDYFVAGVK